MEDTLNSTLRNKIQALTTVIEAIGEYGSPDTDDEKKRMIESFVFSEEMKKALEGISRYLLG